ncbi:MAG TPA: hypothetical protein VGN86_04855, partial [Pyrinomonadaceae bacterium]|nr:hypothetical protein [Pyrinomonadaceae bacterium]
MRRIKSVLALLSLVMSISCSGARQANSPTVAANQESAKQQPAGLIDKVGDAKGTMSRASLTEAEPKTELPE